jgi:hypothetical protein
MSNLKTNFLKELFELYDKYNLYISHEDSQGSFILETNEKMMNYHKEWMKECTIKF